MNEESQKFHYAVEEARAKRKARGWMVKKRRKIPLFIKYHEHNAFFSEGRYHKNMLTIFSKLSTILFSTHSPTHQQTKKSEKQT